MPRRPLLAALAACHLAAACAAPPPVVAPGRISIPAPVAEVDRANARTFVEVASRIEPVAESECRRLNPGADCDFRIVVDDRPGMPANAFQTLDRSGRPLLAFTLALIGEVENADEIALVMAHEASHHIAGHLDRQAESAALGAELFGRLATATAGATPEAVRAAQEIGAEVGARSYSKEFELEADALGARVATLGGFDALRGARFFLRIPDPGQRFLGTHPSTAERLATVQRAVADLGA